MNTIVFIRPLKERELMITTAIRMGFRVAIVDQPNSDLIGTGDIKVTVASIRDYDAVYDSVIKIAETENIVGVYTTLDYLLPVVAKLNSALKLKGIVDEQGDILFNKKLQKESFVNAKIPTAKYCLVQNASQSEISFPCIIKPTDRTGSRGVYKIKNKSEYDEFINLSLVESWSNEVLVEEFIQGEEFSVEGFFKNGQYNLIGVTGKNKTVSTTIIEDSLIFPHEIADKAPLCELMTELHLALNLDNVVTHIEVISNESGLYVVEVNGRIGGALIPDMVLKSIGINLYEIQYSLFLGKEIDIQPSSGFAVQSVIKHEVGEIVDFKIPNIYPNNEVYIYKPIGAFLHEPNHKNDAIGYVISIFANLDEAISCNEKINDGTLVTLR